MLARLLDMAHRRTESSPLIRVRPDLVGGVALAVFVLPITIGALVQLSDGVAPWIPYATAALFIVLHATAAVGWRWPAMTLCLGSAIMLALAFLPLDATTTAAMLPSSLAFLLIVLFAARTADPRVGIAALALGIAGALVIVTAHRIVVQAGPMQDTLVDLLAFVGLSLAVVAVWAIGRLVRARDVRSRERAADRVRAAIAAERRSISRDLHDIVAHTMTVMIAQAEAGIIDARRDPSASVHTLARVAELGRESMRDMRAMLTVLDDGGDAAALVPAPDMANLGVLVEGAAGPGREVTLLETGTPTRLARDVELAVYRTVQEALTNVVRHVRPPVIVRVHLDWTPGLLVLEIADDGGSGINESPRGEGAGRGLIGMRERVERAGGTLEVSRAPGWTVRATLPTLRTHSP